MTDQDVSASGVKNIALIAHDNCKQKLCNWVVRHRGRLEGCQLHATGTTGKLIEEQSGMQVHRFHSGPLGGDQQIGALISEGKIDLLIFFWDPLEPMSHDPDIKALLRLATLWNVPTACNESTANFLVSSPSFSSYRPERPSFEGYLGRSVP
ncbi:methylglyoxal synthase [Hahella ganghwensis]|uniref:methylglyoxal synthase n=1 Tax=Hahella ganghwensis TaxID=286420 RepID=UPI000365F902|nr:methylglyoxal synthase [Hahella ganghwensis]